MLLNIDLNLERLFISSQSATNSTDFPWKYAFFSTWSGAIVQLKSGVLRQFTKPSQEQRGVIFELPGRLSPGTRPLQGIPHPRDQRTGLVPGIARGGMVTGGIQPCIRKIGPGISTLERLWFRQWAFHVPNLMHKLLQRIYFENQPQHWLVFLELY